MREERHPVLGMFGVKKKKVEEVVVDMDNPELIRAAR